MQVEPEQCIVFEDTKLGLQAAHAANMDCMMVEEGRLIFYPLEK
jgi:HAD superfamily hydrolase (TIGR01509 family)